MPAKLTHQAPPGTRDCYPLDAAKRHFISQAWRRASLLHGFEEVDGPTFEHLDLYTVKSGEGIVSELFSFQRAGGERTYALRPEFTPTLARLYAAKANALPKPTKWFTAGPFFRAERPQRGRLREFLQWNVDMLGDASPSADAEVIATCVAMLRAVGLSSKDIRIKVNHRKALADWLAQRGLPQEQHAALFKLLDGKAKMPPADFARDIGAFGFTPEQATVFQQGVVRITVDERTPDGRLTDHVVDLTYFADAITPLAKELAAAGVLDWIDFDLSVVRGLAYYTGMVFEVFEASGAERAIAGGGRYDNLVELFNGPSTPAVGFGMGDVVLSLVLQDKGLMPSDDDLLRRAGHLADLFVLPNGSPEAETLYKQLVAQLRALGFAARHSYKTTRNIGKLLQDANAAKCPAAIIVEGANAITLKSLMGPSAGQQVPLPLSDLAPLLAALAQLGVRPRS